MAFLEVKGLTKSFGQKKVLRGIDFSLEKNKTLAVVGASGGGKTTLLRCLTLLETPDGGIVGIDGREYSFDGGKSRSVIDAELRGKVGLVSQTFDLFPQYTAAENIALPLALAEKERAKKGLLPLYEDDSLRVKELLLKMGLEDNADQYPCTLSGGQRQRVAIARAIALSPSILCFDEPTSALDPALSDEVAKVINALEEIAVVVVTHDMRFAAKVADKTIIIENGVAREVKNAQALA